MTLQDPVRIAAGLTPKPQAILVSFPDGVSDIAEPAGTHEFAIATLMFAPALIERDPTFRRLILTPLGRAVRAALTPTDGAAP